MSFKSLGLALCLVLWPLSARALEAPRGGQAPCPDPVGMGRMVLSGKPGPILVAAPHEPFDRFSGALAQAVAAELQAPCLVAEGYWLPEGRLNVNRPTMGAGLGPEGELPSLAAQAVYRAYLGRVLGAKPRLLLEIHGNSRAASAHQVEVAHRGLPAEAPLWLASAAQGAMAALPPGVPRLPLAVEGLSPIHYQGQAAKAIGAFAEVPMAVQMEFPWALRAQATHREAYGRLVGQSMRALAQRLGLLGGEAGVSH